MPGKAPGNRSARQTESIRSMYNNTVAYLTHLIITDWSPKKKKNSDRSVAPACGLSRASPSFRFNLFQLRRTSISGPIVYGTVSYAFIRNQVSLWIQFNWGNTIVGSPMEEEAPRLNGFNG